MHHIIDYLGTLVLSAAATSLILLTSLGGTTYPWKSAPIYILGACGIVLIGVFVLVERRAAEPVLPLHLFRTRVFSVTSLVGFIVGFAMFGAITYLPAFFQVVRGVSPTLSGVYLLPLMAGLLVVSIGSGQIISRTGKYRFFPIAGTALMTIGLYLLSLMGVGSSTLQDAVYMLVLGLGLGGVMQVLVIIVQNGVPHSELGVATSGATFFRSIGGSFGTAIFGAIFANVLVGNLAKHLHGISLPSGFSAADATPALLKQLPAVVHAGFVAGYAESIQTVFIVAVPIAALAFLATWLIPQVELKQWPEAGSAQAGRTAPAPGEMPSETALSVAGAEVSEEAMDDCVRAADAEAAVAQAAEPRAWRPGPGAPGRPAPGRERSWPGRAGPGRGGARPAGRPGAGLPGLTRRAAGHRHAGRGLPSRQATASRFGTTMDHALGDELAHLRDAERGQPRIDPLIALIAGPLQAGSGPAPPRSRGPLLAGEAETQDRLVPGQGGIDDPPDPEFDPVMDQVLFGAGQRQRHGPHIRHGGHDPMMPRGPDISRPRRRPRPPLARPGNARTAA